MTTTTKEKRRARISLEEHPAFTGDVWNIPRGMIRPSPLNPRQAYDQAQLEELAASIASDGVIQPLIVRPVPGGDYEIIAGHRRYRAAEIAGLDRIPCIVRDVPDDAVVVRMMLAENIRRSDLNAIEEAAGIRTVLERGVTQAEVARDLGWTQPTVAKRMMLLDLPGPVQEMIRKGKLTASHGLALHSLADWPDACTELAQKAVAKKTPSRELERNPLSHAAGLVAIRHLPKSRIGEEWVSGWKECVECPHRRAGEYTSDWCLNPECLDALQDRATATKASALQAALREHAVARGEDPATVPEVPQYAEPFYELPQLRHSGHCYACDKDCPHRKPVVCAGVVEWICDAPPEVVRANQEALVAEDARRRAERSAARLAEARRLAEIGMSDPAALLHALACDRLDPSELPDAVPAPDLSDGMGVIRYLATISAYGWYSHSRTYLVTLAGDGESEDE